jgi:diadenylate cyclase
MSHWCQSLGIPLNPEVYSENFLGTTSIGRIVVQGLPEPSLDFGHAHCLALGIVSDLIAIDFAETEVSRVRVCEIKPTHARSRPHRKRFRDPHSGIGLHIQQTPERTLLRVIRARRIARSRPDPAILFVNEIFLAQTFIAAVTPFAPHALVQVFSERFSQPVFEGFRHDGVVVVMLGPEPIAQLFQPDPAGHGESSDVVGQACLSRRDEVGERTTGIIAFPVRLLAQKVEPLKRVPAGGICIKLDIILQSIGREEAVYAMGANQILFDDGIQQSVRFLKDLARLRTLLLVLKDARVNAFQPPSVEQGRPVTLGDENAVLAKSRSLILDPLLGHPEASRHVTNLNLRGTIKELAQLDGGFVVSHEGIVLSACRYLDAVAAQVDVPLGLGSRHIAAASMSAATKAVGIVVSESSVVRLFCHGQLVGEIIPELWMMDHAVHLRGKVKREQIGALTVLTPNQRPASTGK